PVRALAPRALGGGHPRPRLHARALARLRRARPRALSLPGPGLPGPGARRLAARRAERGQRGGGGRLPGRPHSFPRLGVAYGAGGRGGHLPAVLNAPNEEAVGAFLDGRIPFTAIPEQVGETLDAQPPAALTRLDDVLGAAE